MPSHSGFHDASRVGFGLDIGGQEKELSELLRNIAAYEQAVGRAFLSRQSQFSSGIQTRTSIESNEAGFACPARVLSSRPMADSYAPGLTYLGQDVTACKTPVTELAGFAFSSPSETQANLQWHDYASHSYSRGSTSTEQSYDATSDNWTFADDRLREYESLNDFNTFATKSNEQIVFELETLMDPFSGNTQGSSLNQGSPDNSVGFLDNKQPSPSSERQNKIVDDMVVLDAANHAKETTQRPTVHGRSHGTGNTFRGWSLESDDALRREVLAQKAAGIEPLQWTKIAQRIGRLSGVQCQARWAEVLDEKIRKGRWAPEEDESLHRGFRRYGNQWSKIAEDIVTRTQRQCRSRWLQIHGSSASILIDQSLHVIKEKA
ncbi:Predicted protein [Taphrina deformans PYCC 5710]|uniref:Uncharacterized protein n=1 Tax=Taphrina deformans (strain PYCC 5710 / ATCC 11124 / CBS 356.35 / IMI 108563 / JCM 9778 / NBRC 8474) TaxID=1097556 RepID=R4XB59_TAPDE|nr:Predicted protein [Taphrina deformans PYCC 5710]|eukprot:CCG82840.1 Predicted protein [Taphrina deformans PYCC 5710]